MEKTAFEWSHLLLSCFDSNWLSFLKIPESFPAQPKANLATLFTSFMGLWPSFLAFTGSAANNATTRPQNRPVWAQNSLRFLAKCNFPTDAALCRRNLWEKVLAGICRRWTKRSSVSNLCREKSLFFFAVFCLAIFGCSSGKKGASSHMHEKDFNFW